MPIQCPYFKEDYSISFEIKEINDLISSNLDNNDSLLGIKKQMENIIKDINSDDKKSYLIQQFKNIIIIIENIISKNNKNIQTLKNLTDILNGKNKFNNNSLDNLRKYNIIATRDWEKFLANMLFSKEEKSGDIYHNFLTKDAIVGVNGAFWAYSSNFHLLI